MLIADRRKVRKSNLQEKENSVYQTAQIFPFGNLYVCLYLHKAVRPSCERPASASEELKGDVCAYVCTYRRIDSPFILQDFISVSSLSCPKRDELKIKEEREGDAKKEDEKKEKRRRRARKKRKKERKKERAGEDERKKKEKKSMGGTKIQMKNLYGLISL